MAWEDHQSQCGPFKVERNDMVGRHFIATRDLRPGDIVLREAPLVTGPPLVRDKLVCVSCYRVLKEDTLSFRYCPRCGWSVCSQKCADSDIHFPECQLTVRNCNGGKIDIDNLLQLHPVYHSLIILRCLLTRNLNPEVWEKLQQFESHCATRRKTGHYEKDRKTVARFLLSQFNLKKDHFTEEDILRLCGIVQVNNYLVRLTEPYFLAVYDVASFIEHNCVPNCAKVFSAKGDLIIKVATSVSKDEHLSICYTDATLGTLPRREKLLEELLACCCQRCCDPTEMQSFCSALRCNSRGCMGYVLPEHPILEADNNNGERDFWRCSTCDSRVSGDDIKHLQDSTLQAASQLDKSDLQDCQKFVADNSTVLHPNHYLLLPARLALARRSLREVDDKELEELQCELSRLLQLIDCVLPAEIRIHGMLLYQLSSAMTERELRRVRCGDISLEELKDNLEEPKKLLQKAVGVLLDQPDVVPEGRLAKLAEERLKSFDSLLKDLPNDATLQQSSLSASLLKVVSLSN